MVKVPKTRRTFCEKCGSINPAKSHSTRRQGSPSAQGEWRYDRKQSGYGGQTEPIFWEKAKTTEKIVPRLECVGPKCRSKRMLAIKGAF
ncbi:60S ribosomal protein L36a-like [Artibeus jamaicensis]|uniref:60S ribosomal protein L36a-like n=1 Tax=Artibeus jamaicensis TaxID=9417 RepID=UPI00235A6C62|nr:60S ribosomal protein L36a-like [Artibeus jamaicensis]